MGAKKSRSKVHDGMWIGRLDEPGLICTDPALASGEQKKFVPVWVRTPWPQYHSHVKCERYEDYVCLGGVAFIKWGLGTP